MGPSCTILSVNAEESFSGRDAQISLFEYARLLHQVHPESPFPRDRRDPLPDADAHRGCSMRPKDARQEGVAVADLLVAYLAEPHGELERLEAKLHTFHVPTFRNDHLRSAAWRADADVVHRTGRWLVENARDRCAATVGVALIESCPAEEDVALLRMTGLLYGWFAPLVASALRRLRDDESRVWLAQRSSGWPSAAVLAAYTDPLGTRRPTGERVKTALTLAHEMRQREPSALGCTAEARAYALDRLDELTGRDDWIVAAANENVWTSDWGKWARAESILTPAFRSALRGSE